MLMPLIIRKALDLSKSLYLNIIQEEHVQIKGSF